MATDQDENELAREAVELAQAAVTQAIRDRAPEDEVKKKLSQLHEARARLDVVRARDLETRPLIRPKPDNRP